MKKYKIHLLLPVAIILFSAITCKKDDNAVLPEVSTYSPLYIASSEATVGVTVVSDGGADIVCGIYMGTELNPESTGIQFQIGSEKGTFLGQITGLTPNTQYYIKAYATNKKGEVLGEEVNFITPQTIMDYDENVYNTVKIGDQLWMAENLQTLRYSNGDLIETTTPATLDISGESSPAYQWAYDANVIIASDYGRLYTWYAATDGRNVCPAGWHVPSDPDWTALETTIGGFSIGGSKLKEYGNSHWISPYNVDANNETCFRALPGGYRNETGAFSYIENTGYWWSATEGDVNSAWIRSLTVQSAEVSRVDFLKNNGASLRCVKN